EELEKDPFKLKQFVLNKLDGASDDIKAVIENTAPDAFVPLSPLRIRPPWDLPSKGNFCLAGDALHPMTPHIGQGGCSALEDAVGLSSCLAEALVKPGREFKGKAFEEEDSKRIELALSRYAKERGWTFQSYLIFTVSALLTIDDLLKAALASTSQSWP
ncbi:FAD-binding domain - like 1, partial [Theobroma cacao]